MIASLRGILLDKHLDQSVVVETGGVGYKVHVPSSTLADLPQPGVEVRLHCHTHVREDALQIFGFLTQDELQVFELLITVNGVGPKLALTSLSGLPAVELVAAIGAGDHKRLQSVPGVGKKTAERMVLELQDKVARLGLGQKTAKTSKSGNSGEVVDALVNLGYRRPAAEKAVALAASRARPDIAAEQLLRQALSAMAELGHG